jgi:hypothetical protein
VPPAGDLVHLELQKVGLLSSPAFEGPRQNYCESAWIPILALWARFKSAINKDGCPATHLILSLSTACPEAGSNALLRGTPFFAPRPSVAYGRLR